MRPQNINWNADDTDWADFGGFFFTCKLCDLLREEMREKIRGVSFHPHHPRSDYAYMGK